MASLIGDVRRAAHLMLGGPEDFDPLLERIGDARFVLLGEATHGTHEFYRLRAQITKRLITERGFDAVAIEADWPDAYRVHRYVQGASDDGDATDALGGFQRFPQWMWRNADMLDFVGWLRAYNGGHGGPTVGLYGLDLYSLYGSIDAVLRFLERVDPAAAQRARERYACFENFGEEPQVYAYATGLGISESCEREAIAQLVELRQRAAIWVPTSSWGRDKTAQKDGQTLEDSVFEVEQNARVVRDAEAYYRNMFHGRVSTWNLRDRHMATTLEELAAHLDKRVGRSKIVVWEHNSHLGDARATYMNEIGEWNVGQLARERFGRDVVLVGFTTYDGTVTAASDWDGPASLMRVRPAIAASYESLFHETGLASFLLFFDPTDALGEKLRSPRQERAIGVVYRPDTERVSHYFEARISEQFDALIHVDRTRAVEPLERTARWRTIEPPETYPFAV
jgi:erythromycin esterase-like protein